MGSIIDGTPKRFPHLLLVRAIALAWIISLTVGSANADEVYDRPQHRDHLYDVDWKDVPAAWQNQPEGRLLFVAHIPPDPPGAAAGAKQLFPNARQNSVDIKLGDKILLAPKAIEQGWRFASATTSGGIIWPVPGAPRVFFARCPGDTVVLIARSKIAIPPTPPPNGLPKEDAYFNVHVRNEGKLQAACDQPFDPPRVLNPGVVNGSFSNGGVQLHVGDTFLLQSPDECPHAWDTYSSSKPGILSKSDTSEKGTRFVARESGVTVLWVPSPLGPPECDFPRRDAQILVAVY